MRPTELRLAYDSGWSDGDPGHGRLRLDAPSPIRAHHLYINARDAQDAVLDELVPTWGVGDVLVVERTGGQGRLVAWVIGHIRHGGSYWKIPVSVRTVSGSFAAHDEVRLSHYLNEAAMAGEPAPQAAAAVFVASTGTAATTIAPVEPAEIHSPVSPQDLATLQAENAALVALLRDLTADKTPLLVMDATT